MTTWSNSLNVRNPIYKLYDYKKNNGTIESLCVINKQLFKESGGGLSPITGSLTSNSIKLITYKDRTIKDSVIIADGGKLKTYNGTTVTEVVPHVPTVTSSGVPGEDVDPGLNDLINLTNCRALALKKDRLFIVGHPTQKNRVHFSWIDPIIGYAVYDYIPAIYFFDVAVEDNDEIVELKVFRNQLIIFCKKSIWTLKGDGASLADLELIKINVPNGCVASESIQAVGNNLFYLSDDHVYSLFASEQEFVSAQIMSDKIFPILKSISLLDRSNSTSIFFDNKYFLSFPSGLTLIYDITLESWTKFTNVKANSFIVRDGQLYFSSNTGNIYRFNENIYSDDGNPISFFMKTKLTDLGMSVNEKKFKKLWITSKQWSNFKSTYDLNILVNQLGVKTIGTVSEDIVSGDSGEWDVDSWDEVTWDFTETNQNEMKIQEKGKDIQFVVSNSKENEPFSLFDIVIEYQMKKPK